MRRPVYRRRYSHSGSLTELENLSGDEKRKGTSRRTREAESIDAPARGGLLRSSAEVLTGRKFVVLDVVRRDGTTARPRCHGPR